MNEEQRKIRERAHAIWEHDGRPHGQDREHWERAEQELRSEQETPPYASAETDPQTGHAPVSSIGSASGLSPSGTTPGGGPGAGQGSIGTGGGSSGGRATGSPAKVRR